MRGWGGDWRRPLDSGESDDMLNRMLASVALSTLLGLSFGGPAASASASSAPRALSRGDAVALAAGTISVNDETHLTLSHESGSEDLAESGQAKGTLPGRVNATIIVGSRISISFTLYPHGGSLSGRGSAQIHSNGRYISFAGTVQITRGSGRFARMHGGGRMYGVLNRETDATTVQVIGKLQG